MRVATAFCRLLRLEGVWVRAVAFEPDRVVVRVALRRRRLVCPRCSFSTRVRENVQGHQSVWRHLDLGVWRLEIRATLRRVRCPVHGVHVEGVPFARAGARFTGDFEDLVAWLATKTDKTATCRLTRIDWQTIGRIIERVGTELIDGDRLSDLLEISIDEVAWRKGHRWAPSRANGTPSTCTPCSGQRSRRRLAWTSSRQTPRSRCRHDDWWRWRFSRWRVEYEHFGQRRRRRRNATVTTTRSGSKITDRTQTPGRHSRRENALVTRMGDDLRFAGLKNREPTVRTRARRSPPAPAPARSEEGLLSPETRFHRQTRVTYDHPRSPAFAR